MVNHRHWLPLRWTPPACQPPKHPHPPKTIFNHSVLMRYRCSSPLVICLFGRYARRQALSSKFFIHQKGPTKETHRLGAGARAAAWCWCMCECACGDAGCAAGLQEDSRDGVEENSWAFYLAAALQLYIYSRGEHNNSGCERGRPSRWTHLKQFCPPFDSLHVPWAQVLRSDESFCRLIVPAFQVKA